MKLQGKVLLPVSALVILGMSVISLILFSVAKKEISNAINSQIELISSEIRTVLDEYLVEQKRNIELYSMQKIFSEALTNSEKNSVAEAEIKNISNTKKEYETIALTDLRGEVVLSNDADGTSNINISDRAYFSESINGNVASSEILISKISGNPVVVFSSPVLGENCEIVGVLFASIDISGFNSRYIDSVKIGNSGYAYMTNSEGVIIAYPDKSEILKLDIKEYDFGPVMIEMKNGFYQYEFRGIQKTVAFRTSNESGWLIGVTANDHDIYAGINRMKILSLIVAGICLAVCISVIFLIVRSVVRPIKKSVKLSEYIAEGNLNIAVDEKELKRSDEVGETVSIIIQNEGNIEKCSFRCKGCSKDGFHRGTAACCYIGTDFPWSNRTGFNS